jgi:hypothetical protein
MYLMAGLSARANWKLMVPAPVFPDVQPLVSEMPVKLNSSCFILIQQRGQYSPRPGVQSVLVPDYRQLAAA